MAEKKKLIPADPNRCQAEERPPHGPFVLGPRPPLVRCDAKPQWIATEKELGADGLRGSMSLCARHYRVLKEQRDDCRFHRVRASPVKETT